MSSLIVIVLILYIVPVVLNLISKEAESSRSGSIYDFSMMPAKGISFLGMIVAGAAVLFIVVSILLNQFRGFAAVTFTVMALLGIMMILAPVKGFWETTVKGDDITASRFWIIKEHARVSDISYCQQGKGSIYIFLNGSNAKALSIDNLCTNISTFRKRMEEENIEIRPYQGK